MRRPLALLALTLLSACGQSGDLYLPDETSAPAAPTAAPPGPDTGAPPAPQTPAPETLPPAEDTKKDEAR